MRYIAKNGAWAVLIASTLILQSCARLPYEAGTNDYQASPPPGILEAAEYPHEPFVGLAISGGGSRSANFAAAVMEELDAYGFLDHIKVISAVSGGTLPAAYYSLKRSDPDWSWTTLRNLVGTNFYRRLWLKHNPWGLLKYTLTEYNRSDMMSEIFDDVLFQGSTFAQLNSRLPELIINATSLESGPWRFTKRQFASIQSRLDTYPISRAVAASSAVPGIFQGIAVRAFNATDSYTYKHLVDGGITENLGVQNYSIFIENLLHRAPDIPRRIHLLRAALYF